MKPKYIPNHNVTKCYKCNGKGRVNNVMCVICKGTGKWKDTHYYLVTKDKEGNNIAFGVDTVK